MAVQNTTAAALTRLKPLVNNNIGAIVENNIRYWEKYKSDEEAKRLIKEAREREFKRKLSNDRSKFLPTIEVGDLEGRYKAERIELLNSQSDMISGLKEQYKATGDSTILAKLNEIKQFYASSNQVTGAFNDLQLKYTEAKKNGTINSVLDKDQIKIAESLLNGRYDYSEKGFGLLNDKGEWEYTSPSKLTEQLKSIQFSGNFDYLGTGKEIASAIKQKKVDGKVDITKENIAAGTLLWKNKLHNNKLLLDTEASKLGLDKNIPIDDFQLNTISAKLFKQYSEIGLDDISAPLKTANTKSIIANRGKGKSNKSTSNINISANKDGVVTLIADPNTDSKTGDKLNTEVYNINKTNFKRANQFTTVDRIYWNKDTKQLSAEISLYETVEKEAEKEARDGTIKSFTETSKGKLVNTIPVTGAEEMSRIANVIGVQDEEGLLNLINDSRSRQEKRQEEKRKKAGKTETKGKGLSAEEMDEFLNQ